MFITSARIVVRLSGYREVKVRLLLLARNAEQNLKKGVNMNINSILRYIITFAVVFFVFQFIASYPGLVIPAVVAYFAYIYFRTRRNIENIRNSAKEQQQTWNSTNNQSWNSTDDRRWDADSSETSDVSEAEYTEREIK